MKKGAGKKKIRSLLIVIFWLFVWQLLALYFHNSILLASPLEVLADLKNNVLTLSFWKTACHSFMHIFEGFFLAFFAAILFGVAAAKLPVVEEFLSPLMQFIKAVPIASFVVLLLIWAGSERLSVSVTFLMVLPVIFQNVLGGNKNTDKELLEMAKVFEMPLPNKIRFLYLPSLMPFLTSGCKAALGMSWKAGIAAEVIGTPEFSIGERIYMSKIYLNTAGLFSWTLVVILLSFLFEKGFLFLLDKATKIKQKPFRVKGKKGTAQWGKEENKKAICMEHVFKSYGEQQIFCDLSLELDAGSIYCVMGHSGVGKSTLFGILLGLCEYQKGTVQRPKGRAAAVFQENRLCMEENAITNVSMVCTKRYSEEAITKILSEILPEEELEKKVSEFSGGMRRRVAIVRALLSDAEWIVMDEPFTGLDEKTREQMIQFILKYRKNRTLLVATHQKEDVEAMGAELIKLS